MKCKFIVLLFVVLAATLMACDHAGANNFSVPEGQTVIDIAEYESLVEAAHHTAETTVAETEYQTTVSALQSAIQGVTADYIANKNTKKFHYPDCSSVNEMNESNKWYFNGSREELIEKGYKPCGRCHP